MVELCVITATIAQSNKLPLHKDKGRKPSFFIATILLNTQARPLKKQVFRNIAFIWLHYCVITATIAQSNKLPLHKDNGRATVLFYCTDITKHTNKTFEKASFSMYIDLFRHTITSALPRTKKPHSVNSLYGFYSTCCNLLLQLKC